MVWCGHIYNGPIRLVILQEKTSFDSKFYTHNVLPIAKEDGIRLIGNDFIYQQDEIITKYFSHISYEQVNHQNFEVNHQSKLNMNFEFIGPEIWPANFPDLNLSRIQRRTEIPLNMIVIL